MMSCFALLDDCDASSADRRSRLYTEYVETIFCASASELPQLWSRLDKALHKGFYGVALFSYELGEDLHGIPRRPGSQPPSKVLLFNRCDRLSSQEVESWLKDHEAAEDVNVGLANFHADVDKRRFSDAIERIQSYIEAGDTYQVNYTWRLRFDAYGSPWGLYRQLRIAQPVPYGALIMLPDGSAVLSLSPELFIRYENEELKTRPMKGTAPASGIEMQDIARADMLAADPKNRAENLMIVDLMRNDLSRIAMPGSVKVPQLFQVSRYNTVLQMTSSVHARPRSGIRLENVFDALYPCGSITGAPKKRTMQIIRELEEADRKFYTGGIGWFDPPAAEATMGEFCLSVPIRTLQLEAHNNGVRKGEMGVGAGIIYDSNAADEYEECLLKASFLKRLKHNFSLIETLYATRITGCRYMDRHLARLSASADYFGFELKVQSIKDALLKACADLPDGSHRLRLTLEQQGDFFIESAALPLTLGPVKILLASWKTASGNLFLRHKTTVRHFYEDASHEAESTGAFDMLFFNERGELTEGSRCNVFVKLNGHWYTPHLHSGVLPGVMRDAILADPEWNAREKFLTLSDLRAAEEVVVCNALRGVLSAQIIWDSAGHESLKNAKDLHDRGGVLAFAKTGYD